MSKQPEESTRVVLYSRADCSLCDDAADMLVSMDIPFTVAREERFFERIPVIAVDGRIVTEGRVSPRPVLAALRRRPSGPSLEPS